MNKVFTIICLIFMFCSTSCVTQYVAEDKIITPVNYSNPMPSDIVGEWRLLTVRINPNDRFVNMTNDKAPTLSVSRDGSFSGYDGCNGYGGTMVVENNNIVLSRASSTSRGCPPYVYWDKELHQALSKVNNYAIQNEKLLLKKDSHILMTFSKK